MSTHTLITEHYDDMVTNLSWDDIDAIDERATKKSYEKMLMKELSHLIRDGHTFELEWSRSPVSSKSQVVTVANDDYYGDDELDLAATIGMVEDEVKRTLDRMWDVGGFWVEY